MNADLALGSVDPIISWKSIAKNYSGGTVQRALPAILRKSRLNCASAASNCVRTFELYGLRVVGRKGRSTQTLDWASDGDASSPPAPILLPCSGLARFSGLPAEMAVADVDEHSCELGQAAAGSFLLDGEPVQVSGLEVATSARQLLEWLREHDLDVVMEEVAPSSNDPSPVVAGERSHDVGLFTISPWVPADRLRRHDSVQPLSRR